MRNPLGSEAVLEFAYILLAAVGTVLLAIASGAGGSALLELYYKPHRDRVRAAKLLLAEGLLNTDLALLQAHARWKALRKIPADFEFSTIGWEASAELISELPPDLLKAVLILYNRYRACNQAVASYVKAVDDLKSLPEGADKRRHELQKFLDGAVDVFNTGLDHAIDDGKKILPELLALAKIKEDKKRVGPPRDYQKVVDQFLLERQTRLEALERLNQGPNS